MFIGTAIFDDRRRDRAMPLPTADAIKRAGIVEAIEVERGDGTSRSGTSRPRGRTIEPRMDRTGKRVLSVRPNVD